MQDPEVNQSEATPTGRKALRALLVEDSAADAELVVRWLEQTYQVQWRRVDDAAGMEAALEVETWDVVLCDYVLPSFGVIPALEILARRKLDIPFLVVSGEIGEETAVAAMKAGAHDYIMKGNLLRLCPAIEREIVQAENRRDRARSLGKTMWLAAIVDSMVEAVVGMDLEGKITSWNAGAAKLYGISAEEAIASGLESMAPLALPIVRRQMLEAIRNGEPLAEFETAILTRRDGSQVDVSSTIAAVRNETGQIIGFAIVALDVTERKQAERERKKLIAELEETLGQVRKLHGLLPICAACKKIRDEKGEWQAIESYISGRSEVAFSHSICPSCSQTLYPDYATKP